MNFDIDFSTSTPTGRGVVRASGEIDLVSASVLAEAFRACLDRGCRSVSVDLRQVSFMDCSGVHVLLRGRREAAVRGAELHVSAWSAAVERVFTRPELDALRRRVVASHQLEETQAAQ